MEDEMLLNAKVCNLVNTATGRHHPIIFREAPLPSGAGRRFKSKAHHTAGFDSRGDSLAECRRLAEYPDIAGEVVDIDFEWNGEGIPAIVTFF